MSAPTSVPEGRDLAVDAARVTALIVVVCVHILLVTVITDPRSGAVSNVMVPTDYPWFWWASWILQIMPLFFVVGGFASAVSWTNFRARVAHPQAPGRARGEVQRHRGPGREDHVAGEGRAESGQRVVDGTGALWARGRLLRLAQPASALWGFLAVVTVGALALGAPGDYLDAALSGVGMHLWFLGAFTLCLVAVPLTHAGHRRRPYTTLLILILLGVGVEVLRVVVGDTWWGLLGLAPIWMAIHQLGYFRADGSTARIPTWALLLVAATGYAAIWLLSSTDVWAVDMLANLNPPTVLLVVLGISQACLLQVLSPILARAMTMKPVQALSWAIGSKPVTLYLWHLPVIVVVMAVWWLVGAPAGEPGEASWWVWRIPLAVLCWAGVLVVARVLGGIEAASVVPTATVEGSVAGGRMAWAPVLVGAVLMVTPAVLEIRYLLSPWLVVGGAVAYVLATVLLRHVTAGSAPGGRDRWRIGADVG